MADKKDYYELLGVSKSATPDEIKRAYRKQAMKYHPDQNKEPGAEQMMKDINEAYSVLSDPEKRSNYDRFGTAENQGFSGGGAGGGFGDIFNQFFHGGNGQGVRFSFGGNGSEEYENIFDGMFNFGGGSQSRRQASSAPYPLGIEIVLNISFAESILGCEKTITYNRNVSCDECKATGAANGGKSIKTCPTCHGSGYVIQQKRSLFGIMQSKTVCPECQGKGQIITEKCPKCNGKGYIKEEKKVSIEIPAGVYDQQILSVANYGHTYKNKTGDLHLIIRVAPSKIFRRENDLLIMDVPIDPLRAIVGGNITVPTPYGKQEIAIPPRTENLTKFRIRNCGFKNIKKGIGGMKNGDLVVVVHYAAPSKMTSAQQKELEKISNELTNDDYESFCKKVSNELK